MHITILLYEDMTALDAIGPYEVLSHVPGMDVAFAALQAGPVTVDTGKLQLIAPHAIADIDRTDVLIVPGGPGCRTHAQHPSILRWVWEIHETTRFTTSVCTGSHVLGAAGLLRGLPATSHWAHREGLAEYGAEPTDARIVRAGKVITAAGVSAGIDMALGLLAELSGEGIAQAVQLAIEYDPEPPFDAGHPSKAPAEIVELVRAIERGELSQAAAR